jgi:hypothetical protein
MIEQQIKQVKDYLDTIVLNSSDVYDAIDEISDNSYDDILIELGVEAPKKIYKPTLKTNHTIDDVKEYGKKLESYNKYLEELETFSSEYEFSLFNIITDYLNDFIKEKSGFNRIPTQYQEKVWHMAHEKGHSAGYTSIYSWLTELSEIFL